MVCFLLQNWQIFRAFGSTSMMADALMLIALAANRTEQNTKPKGPKARHRHPVQDAR
jgi:hypothetical protein